MTSKQRLTVTVDPELIEAGNQAVAAGSAPSLSAWVNDALTSSMIRDRRLRALAKALEDYEQEFGEISEEAMAARRRADRTNAIVIRGQHARSADTA